MGWKQSKQETVSFICYTDTTEPQESWGWQGPLHPSGPLLLQQGYPEQGGQAHSQAASEHPQGRPTASEGTPVLQFLPTASSPGTGTTERSLALRSRHPPKMCQWDLQASSSPHFLKFNSSSGGHLWSPVIPETEKNSYDEHLQFCCFIHFKKMPRPLASQHEWSHCSLAGLTTAVRNTAGIQSTCLEAPSQLHVLIINSHTAINVIFSPHQYAASHLHKAGNYFLLPLALMHTCVNRSFMHGKSAHGSMPPQVNFPHKRGFQAGEIRLTILQRTEDQIWRWNHPLQMLLMKALKYTIPWG